MQIKIGFLAASPELADRVRHVAMDFAGSATVIMCEEVDRLIQDTSIQAAKKMEADCDALITCSDVQALVAPEMAIPVIECPVTFPDILNALLQARELGKNILLNLHYSEDHDLGPWPEILGIRVRKVLTPFCREAFDKIRDIWDTEAIVVGGALAVGAARELGLPSQLITISEATIIQSFQKAIEVAAAPYKEERLQTLIDLAQEGIIYLEENHTVAHANNTASEILKTPRQRLIGRNITEVFKTNSGSLEKLLNGQDDRPIIGKLLKLDGLSIIANIMPVRASTRATGMVVTFFEASRLQNLEQNVRRQMARRFMTARFTLDDIIGTSSAIANAKQQARFFAATAFTVLIHGESGVGKELFAQSIHNLSSRKKGPFVAINCSAMPKELMESEFFGYEEGAFTGAKKGGKEGLFELAHGGTIFLDEIGDMSLELQSKILRVLQEKEVTRLGGNTLIPVDVRIIAATNRDIKEEVQQGRFRQDLYFRLNVLSLHVPPLRERPEDIPLFFNHFLRIQSRQPGYCIQPDRLQNVCLLQEYSWPGNVRELQNFCERFAVLAGQQENPDRFLMQLLQESRQEFNPEYGLNLHELKLLENGDWRKSWRGIEKSLLEQVLAESGITRTALAKSMGISRTALWKKLK